MDAAFELKKYERLIYCLQSIATQKLAIADSENLSEESIDLLKQHFKENHDYVNYITKTHKTYNELKNETRREINPMKAKILIAELSLLTSLLFVKVLSEINPVDHIERYRLKVKYIEEDVEMFEALLNNYYFHGLVTGTIVDMENIQKPSDITNDMYRSEEARRNLKKVHPYCAIILDLKDQTADRIRKYALGNTFRPEEPSYSSFVKVSTQKINVKFDTHFTGHLPRIKLTPFYN